MSDGNEALRLGLPTDELRIRLALNYNAACIFACAASKALFLAPETERQLLSRRYHDRAVELIHQTLSLLPAQARAPYIQQMLADPALDPIRHDQAFLREVGK